MTTEEGVGNQNQRSRPWATAITAIAVPILVAVVALVGTALGAYYANKTSQESQRAQIQEDRARSDREKRAEAYLAFLDAALSYSSTLQAQIVECMSTPEAETNPDQDYAQKACTYRQYLGMLNDHRDLSLKWIGVTIYGTDAAAGQAFEIMGTLPAGNSFEEMSPRSLDTQVFSERTAEFMSIACRELPYDSRAGCG